MATESLLSSAMREYLRGEKEDISTDYKNKLENRIRERVSLGMVDMALLGNNLEKVGPVWLLMDKRGGDQPITEEDSRREGWREMNANDAICGALRFLMEIASTFNYGPSDWQTWIEEAYEAANPGSYANVTFNTIQELDLDELETVFEGDHDSREKEELKNVELRALYENGRINLNEYVDAGGHVRLQ